MTVAPKPRTGFQAGPASAAISSAGATPDGIGPAQPRDPAQGPSHAEPPGSSATGLGGPTGRHRREPEGQASYREVFAVGEFRALWTAQVLSYAGDQFAQVAIAILVYGRTKSPFLTALAYALTYLPPIAGGPLLSGLADLFPRRRVMIACDVLRMGTVGLMAIPGMPLAPLCVLLFFTVLAGAPFSSARTALMPDVLPGDKFVLGSAISNMTFQVSQIVGFVAGAAVVATLGTHLTLGVDAVTFCVSALIVSAGVRRRPSPRREGDIRPSLWAMSADGVRIVFGSPVLRTLLLFGWLAGFAIVPEGLAAPYAHSLHRGTLVVGLLMAAIPFGTVIGAFLFGRLVAPSARLALMGWLAMLSCAPLIASAWNPPLEVILPLWALAGAGGAYQLAAAAAFVQALAPDTRARAFGLAQSGLYAVQGLGILAGGAVAEFTGPPLAVGLAGLTGLTAAAMLAMRWVHLRGRAIQAQHGS
ncbi:MAG TPA: MFS transporter [Streptosporangiaceae bacterium]|nr:MFS transporter [Streptosporangiaceae bacterium]